MTSLVRRISWLFALRGIAAILFGILAYMQPGITLAALILLFGAYSLVDGVIAVFASLANRNEYPDWWIAFLAGLLGIGIGIVTFLRPDLTTLALLVLIAARALVVGVLEIAAAIQLRKVIEGEWLLVLAGVASIFFGLAVLMFPIAGALAIVWLIAAYAVVYGVLQIVLAVQARKWGQAFDTSFGRLRTV
jgi:uncharacterized membrane protein HdeD (DUF308 family)